MGTIAEQFSAAIYKLGINPCVEVPLRVSRAFGRRGYVPVAGKLNGKPFLANLVPTGEGRHRLFINGEMRERARVDVGSRITVVLRVDSRPRKVPMPKELVRALRSNRDVNAAWGLLTPSRQKEILRYLNFAKQPETLQRNVKRVIALLQKKLPPKERLGGIRVRER